MIYSLVHARCASVFLLCRRQPARQPHKLAQRPILKMSENEEKPETKPEGEQPITIRVRDQVCGRGEYVCVFSEQRGSMIMVALSRMLIFMSVYLYCAYKCALEARRAPFEIQVNPEKYFLMLSIHLFLHCTLICRLERKHFSRLNAPRRWRRFSRHMPSVREFRPPLFVSC